MRAVEAESDGPPDVLRIGERARPEPAPDEVLVRVAYAGLNRADLLERAGRYGPPAAPGEARPIPGLEFGGTVVAAGARARRLQPGDRVCGIVAAGAHADYLAVHALACAKVPAGLSLRDAAAIPEAYLTAHDALFARGDFGFGKSVLVHAVGSGVGLAAVALATGAGGIVFGTSRTPAKLERAQSLGMRLGFAADDDFDVAVRGATGGRGADLVLDFIGGAELDRNLGALAVGGRIVQIGTLAGSRASIDLTALMVKRATIVGTVLRSRGLEEKIVLARLLEERLLPAFAAGRLAVEIDRVFAVEEIVAAHRHMEANANFGKIVIRIDPAA